MLPGPFERWTRELAGRPFPEEPRATCGQCAMGPEAPELPPDGPFRPEVRCCTYQPHLPPYLVGAILADDAAPGRAAVRARLEDRVGVSPHGLAPPAAYAARYQRALADPRAFGRTVELACGYLDGDRCGVWAHRGAACAVYHCKLERGARAASVWSFVGVALTFVDRAVRRWLLGRHGLDVAPADALLADPAAYERAWGGWLGREADYFASCARLVADLTWRDVEALGGAEMSRIADGLRAARASLDDTSLPARVRRGGDVLYPLGATRALHPSVPNDLLAIPPEVAARLAALDEAPLAELGIEATMIRRLLDWQVLVPAG